jgi:hypothetical protein
VRQTITDVDALKLEVPILSPPAANFDKIAARETKHREGALRASPILPDSGEEQRFSAKEIDEDRDLNRT